MTLLHRWLAGSLFLGWLLKIRLQPALVEGSLIIRILKWIVDRVRDLLQGSWFLSWLVRGESRGGTADPGLFGPIFGRLWDRLLQALWSLGAWARPLIEGSILLSRPAVAVGLVLALAVGADLAVNEPRGSALAVKICLLLLGVLLVIWRPTREWWRVSLVGRFLAWWNGYPETAPGERPGMEYSLFLVIAYCLVDYVLRTYSPYPLLVGVWDELLFILIVGILLVRTGLQNLSPQGTGLLVPFLLYLSVYVFLFIIKSPETAPAVEGLRVYLQYTLWFFVGANLLFNRSQFKWLCDIFLLVVFLVALYGVYQYYIGVEIPTSWYDSKVETSITTRVFSIIGSPNVLGSLLVLAIPISLSGLLTSRNGLKQVVYGGIFLTMLACLVFTLSRGAWLALGITVILLGLWLDRRILYGLLIVAVLTPVAVPSVYDRLAYMTTPEYMASSERGGRIGRWTKTLATWQSAPATGVGLGRFGGAVAARYYPNDSFYADNFYLKTGAEAGWMGFGALLLLLVAGIRLARSSLDQVDDPHILALGLGVLTGLLGILAHNAVENIFEVPMMATYFWFLLGLLAALPRVTVKAGGVREHYEEA
ncbi:MAG: O-antigen ligase family protein [Syntrophomonadales bacterium]|jgi:O-antigen ligase